MIIQDYFSLCQFRLIKWSFFIHNTMPYIHPRHMFSMLKNRLIETVLLSTHNICFGGEIRKLIFWYALLTKVL